MLGVQPCVMVQHTCTVFQVKAGIVSEIVITLHRRLAKFLSRKRVHNYGEKHVRVTGLISEICMLHVTLQPNF